MDHFPVLVYPWHSEKSNLGVGMDDQRVRKTRLFVSVIVLTYSGLKYHVLHPKNFLNQHTFRGPHGRHSLLFILVCSANVERQTFLLPLPTQALL